MASEYTCEYASTSEYVSGFAHTQYRNAKLLGPHQTYMVEPPRDNCLPVKIYPKKLHRS